MFGSIIARNPKIDWLGTGASAGKTGLALFNPFSWRQNPLYRMSRSVGGFCSSWPEATFSA
jgi:hypothetical protein